MPAVQFLTWDGASYFMYVPGSLEGLFREYPGAKSVKVVSIVGPARDGKTFLQNQLAADGMELGAVTQHFHVGHNPSPETKGLWAYLREEVPGSGQLVLHVDVEGSDDNNRTGAYDAKLMAIIVMISSSVIYNVKGTLNAEHFKILSGVTLLAQTVTAGCGDDVDLENFNFAKCRGPMPHLWFLIRDSTLQDKPGCSADDWLEEQLNVSTAQDEDTIEVKKSICHYFPFRNLRRLPVPTPTAVDVVLAKRLPTMAASEWAKAFRDGLADLKAEVLAATNVVQVSGMDSRCIPVDPISFPNLVMKCVETANNGKSPLVASGFPGGIFAPIVARAQKAASAAGWAVLGDQWKDRLPLKTEKLLDIEDEVSRATSAVGSQEGTLLLGASVEDVSKIFLNVSCSIMEDVAAANRSASTKVCDPVVATIREAAARYKNKLIGESTTDPVIANEGTSMFRQKCVEWKKYFDDKTNECHEDVTYLAFDELHDELLGFATEVDTACSENNEAQKEELRRQMEDARLNQAKQAEKLRELKKRSEEARQAAVVRQTQLENEKAAADALRTNIRLQQEELDRRRAQLEADSAQQNEEMRKLQEGARAEQEKVVRELREELARNANKRETDEEEYRISQASANDAMMKLLHAIHSRPMPQFSSCLGANALVSVEGRGDVRACDVMTGDRVAAFDCSTQTIVWSEVYFAAAPSHNTHTITITTSNGASVEMTPDHLLIHLPKSGTPEAIPAGSIRAGDAVLDHLGALVSVTEVSLTDAAPRPIAAVLTCHGTVVASGIVCSSYDGGHLLGIVENFDLRLLYAVAPLWVSGSKLVKSYAAMCDRFIHAPCRRLLGLDSPKQLIQRLYLVGDTLSLSPVSQYWINALKWIPTSNHK